MKKLLAVLLLMSLSYAQTDKKEVLSNLPGVFISLEYVEKGSVGYKLDTDYKIENKIQDTIEHNGEMKMIGIGYNVRNLADIFEGWDLIGTYPMVGIGLRHYQFEPDEFDISQNDESATSAFVEIGLTSYSLNETLAPLHLSPFIGLGYEQIWGHGDLKSVQTATISAGTLLVTSIGDLKVEYRVGFERYYYSHGLSFGLNIPLHLFY